MNRCAKCDHDLPLGNDGRESVRCPECGSMERHLVKVNIETINVEERYWLRRKGHSIGRGRRSSDLRQGHDMYQKTGKWSILYRFIDHIRDLYRESIVDAATGEAIREVDEPLSQHQKRGSAKQKK